ncbi:hypothetical protein AB0B81_07820, partial [Streptomyces sp. NPDC039028]
MTEPDSTLANAAALLGGITEQLGFQLGHVRPYGRRPRKDEQEVPPPMPTPPPTTPAAEPARGAAPEPARDRPYEPVRRTTRGAAREP